MKKPSKKSEALIYSQAVNIAYFVSAKAATKWLKSLKGKRKLIGIKGAA